LGVIFEPNQRFSILHFEENLNITSAGELKKIIQGNS